ncbi:MAG: DNA ligase [Pseudomonas sp.]|nr:DNA ligase [Pseudomonas sp.]
MRLHGLWFVLFIAWSVATAASEGALHQPMLPKVYPGSVAIGDYWVSEKLDGVRGHWDGDRLWTRNGYPIQAPDWFTRGWPTRALEGELWMGRGQFDAVSAIVRSTHADDADWLRVKFMVFDLPDHGGSFDQRVQAMGGIADAAVPWLEPIRQFRVATLEELDRKLEAVVGAGGEGLMLHHGSAVYRSGRSDHLLKYKLHSDAEARVVGYTAGRGKYAGMTGALEVESADGRRFRLGSGLSEADRAEPPPIGSWVTYRYNGLTSTGLPRFARFLRVRVEFEGQAASAGQR